jgi:DNA-binding GntR family transcriptional regulator
LTNADLAELEKLHEKLEAHYRDNDPHAYVQHRRYYHEFIQEKTGNPVLSRIVSALRGRIQLHRFRQIYRPSRLDGSMDKHRGLMEGKLLIDATCTPADITFPTDLKILNAAREKRER